jgi:hypothetical protein
MNGRTLKNRYKPPKPIKNAKITPKITSGSGISTNITIFMPML